MAGNRKNSIWDVSIGEKGEHQYLLRRIGVRWKDVETFSWITGQLKSTNTKPGIKKMH